MKAAKWFATCLGIGYIEKGAGTVAALFCCGLWWFCRIDAAAFWIQLIIIAFIYFIGIWSAGIVEKEWGHDSNRIVIDEVSGMSISLFLLPQSWIYFSLAFVLFRFFDIIKPLGIRKMETLSGGYGVMGDDLLAGIYTTVILHIIIKSHLF